MKQFGIAKGNEYKPTLSQINKAREIRKANHQNEWPCWTDEGRKQLI